jgi:hypothetical protein
LDDNDNLIFRCPVVEIMRAEPEFIVWVVLQREYVIEISDIAILVGFAIDAAPLME